MTLTTPKAARLWERDPLDWYVEPPRVTEQLLAVEGFGGRILDPACGQGNIVTTLRAAGLDAHGTDIADRSGGARWFLGKSDFLAAPLMAGSVDCIVTNPPFYRAKGTEAFIRKALVVASHKVAAFTDMRFLGGAGRAKGIFAAHPPDRVWVVTPRPSCPPGDYLAAGNEAGGGTADWVWLVWDWVLPAAQRGLTRLGWLRA